MQVCAFYANIRIHQGASVRPRPTGATNGAAAASCCRLHKGAPHFRSLGYCSIPSVFAAVLVKRRLSRRRLLSAECVSRVRMAAGEWVLT